MFERIPRLWAVGAACALMAGPVRAADYHRRRGATFTLSGPVRKWSTDKGVSGVKVN